MEVINEVEKHSDCKEDVVDVSDDLQDSACKLWDLCMDQDVAVFLLGFDIVDILGAVILKSKSPRLTEISVGIFGNMACSGEACGAITNKDSLRSLLLALLASPDVQTLIELVRLLRVCLTNKKYADSWLESIENEQAEIIQNSQFIFGSSTNVVLLRSLAEVFDKIFEASDAFVIECCSSEFVKSLLESIQQINTDDPCNSLYQLCHSLHALHSISIQKPGKVTLVKNQRSVVALLSFLSLQWMTTHPKVEYNSSMEMSSSEVSASCCLSVANILLEASDVKNLLTDSDAQDEDSETEQVQEIDDEDRALLVKFARCIVSAKGVLSALTVVSSLTVNDENQNEFKTPLHIIKNSPGITTPLLSTGRKPGDPKSACATPVSGSAPTTPDRTPEVGKHSPLDGDRTPPAESSSVIDKSPTKRLRNFGEDSWREESPASILCSLAKELLQTVEDVPANEDSSPSLVPR
uniref:Protein saal1-like n=1 Tax=Phallusia mammillata TaxID=59560 RepID=A0A6F9DSH4_9ASCI|nr:protein saal1-like [Phallusia mammillata]